MRVDREDAFRGLHGRFVIALRNGDSRCGPGWPSVERVERLGPFQFAARGNEISFHTREIPGMPAVSIGRIRIEGDTTFQLAFRHRKIAVKNQGYRAEVNMTRTRALIVRHRHEGGVLCWGQNFQRRTISIHDRQVSPCQIAPSHGKVRILDQRLAQQRDRLLQALLV